jgi:hypothetical protein
VPSSEVRHAAACACLRCRELVAAVERSPEPVGWCDGCQGTHPASYSHEGSYGEGAVYEVPCPIDGLSTFVTTEGLVR